MHFRFALLIIALISTGCQTTERSTQADPNSQTDQSDATATFRIEGISDDPSYGYRPTNPILVGGFERPLSKTVFGERMSLLKRLLKTAKGQTMTWKRARSCCPLGPEQDGSKDRGLLDIYLVSVPGERPIRLFVNHYKSGPIYAPVGFGFYSSITAEENAGTWQDAFGREDLAKVIALLTGPAKAGEIFAQYYLAVAYMGLDRPQDAVSWFKKAAEQNHSESQTWMYLSYRNGTGTDKNEDLANEWLRKAAINRSPRARTDLAHILAVGPVAGRNLREASKWYYLAAEQGVLSAQTDFGMALLKGQGIKQIPIRGLTWLAIAKRGGDAIGTRLFDKFDDKLSPIRRGIIKKAVDRWYKQPQPSDFISELRLEIISPSNIDARFEYGVKLYSGIETARRKDAGLAYIAYAADSGNTKARKAMEAIGRHEPSDVMKRAKERAAKWRAKQH